MDGELIENIRVENGAEEAEFDTTDRVGGSFSHKFEFIGVDIAGNQTKTAEYNYSNTGALIMIILAIIILIGITAFLVIQVRNGKLKFLGYRGTTQLKIKLEDKENKEENEQPLITPRKEY